MSAGSFAEFVAAEAAASHRTAFLLTGDRRAAGDLLQEALIAVHRRWDRFADRAEATAAVRRELVAAHVGRRWNRVGEVLAGSPLLAGATGLPGFGPPTSDPGPQDETTAALAELLPGQRAAVVLRHGADLSEEATADALGASVTDGRALTGNGLRRLAELREVDGAAAVALVHDLAERAPAAPGDVHAWVLDGERSQRRHRAGVLALAGFLAVVVVLLVLVTL